MMSHAEYLMDLFHNPQEYYATYGLSNNLSDAEKRRIVRKNANKQMYEIAKRFREKYSAVREYLIKVQNKEGIMDSSVSPQQYETYVNFQNAYEALINSTSINL